MHVGTLSRDPQFVLLVPSQTGRRVSLEDVQARE